MESVYSLCFLAISTRHKRESQNWEKLGFLFHPYPTFQMRAKMDKIDLSPENSAWAAPGQTKTIIARKLHAFVAWLS